MHSAACVAASWFGVRQAAVCPAATQFHSRCDSPNRVETTCCVHQRRRVRTVLRPRRWAPARSGATSRLLDTCGALTRWAAVCCCWFRVWTVRWRC